MKEIRQNIETSQENTLNYWQNKLFERLVWLVGFFGVPLLPIGAWFFFDSGQYISAVLEILFAIIILFVILSKKISVDQKKPLIIALLYMVSIMILIFTGPKGAGLISVSLSLILGACILVKRQLIRIAVFNIIIFLFITVSLFLGLLDNFHIMEYKATWIINALVTQFSGLGLSAIIFTISNGLENQAVEVSKAKDAYERSIETSLTMVENISDVIGIVNEEGVFQYVSPNIAHIFNWTSEEMIDTSVYDYLNQEEYERNRKFYRDILEVRKPLTIETHFKNKSGQLVDVQLTAIDLIDNKNIQGILINFHDVSNIVETNRQLRAAKIRAEVANDAKNSFLSSMSHELRTPLNGILGALQLLELTQITNEQMEYIQISKSSAKALADIIGDVLDYAKLQAHEMQVENSTFNLRTLMEALCDEFEEALASKGVDMHLYISENVSEMTSDLVKIRRILIHLLDNAVKFTQKGSIEVYVKKYDQANPRIEWTITDTGIGIEEEKFDYIFDYFSQADSTTTRIYGGSGLGLSICKQMLDLLGGRISLESKMGEGSTFTVTIPYNK